MPEGLAITGIQDLGVGVLSTNSTDANGLQAPFRGFRFTANFEGLGVTSFKSVSGAFETTIEPTSDYREGGFGRLTSRKLPGLVTYGSITLEKGLYSNPVLYNFFNDYLEGNNFHPVNATIIVYDAAGNPQASWTVINAWPTRYKSGDLAADSSDILIEELELVHEGVKRDVSVAAA